MVKISGTNFTAGNENSNRTAEKTGEGHKVPVSGAGLSAHAGASAKTAPFQSAGGVPAAFQSFLQLARTLGLPQDTLSVSILSLARYFSLPLNPGFLAKIRRDSLSPAPEKSASGEEAPSPRNRETLPAKTFAALAAAAKGVELSPRGLEKYAWSLGGNSGGGSGDGGSGNGGSGGGERRKQTEGDGPAAVEEQRRPGKAVTLNDTAGADKLREKIVKIEEQDPLLRLLNRLPGKNGQRWIVIPFSLAGETRDYRVSLRILLHEAPSNHCPDRLVLDVSGGDRQTPDFRRLFMLDRVPGGVSHLTVHVWPPENEKTLAALKKDMSRSLSIPSKQIDIQNDEIFPSFEADCRDNVLQPVNKEV
jgi:hypothetical protein